MTDLTFCYLHMTSNDLKIIDTLGTAEQLRGDLSDDEMDIPAHMIPPNPDDSEILPSQVHPSYPYGNPTSTKHPAARPRVPYDPTSRALFEDMGYGGGGVNGTLRWSDLALETLLPTDHEREEAERAAQARRMASGVAQTGQQAPPSATGALPNPDETMQTGDNGEATADEGEDDTSEPDMGHMMQGQSEDEELEEEEEEDEDYVHGEGIWTDDAGDEGFFGADDDNEL
ncbi:unnamed protein product [Peniophora sp. CBMAI 1063]|nr:unnamed protein product [Peniophora sp. CBMAI 1063]